ncbi:tyrosine-type recombinase/integrase [Chlamydia avium]|uniref:Virulence plasmid integrase pGP7-D n=1 Tax=Chlamydia avium 10DC88 TaxID=1229831 RepID=W8K1W9_9CHLA|nr:site-specific integrase [Chlamydia avium]AHK63822.1 Virulence plasmid integrase pGP7-D [Chlamydia avium 10DC88]
MSNLVYQHKSRLFLTVLEAANVWLATLSPITRKNYASGIRFLVSNKILDASMKLEKLVYVDHWDVLNRIKSLTHTCSGKPVSEASKQARAACYISFTKFLYRLTKGVIKQAIPSRDFGNSTFYKIRDKVKTEFISKQEWLLFFDSLKRISFRDYLIGKLIIQGVRKLSEVISLRTEDLLFSQNQITFKIKKRQSRYNEVRVVYPNFLMQELRDYVGNRDGWVFISGNGQQVAINQVYYYFKLAENDMNLSIKVTPHVLRASALAYLKKIGCADEAIMRVSCFSSTQMLSAYDTNTINNQTSQFPLIF